MVAFDVDIAPTTRVPVLDVVDARVLSLFCGLDRDLEVRILVNLVVVAGEVSIPRDPVAAEVADWCPRLTAFLDVLPWSEGGERTVLDELAEGV
jgi:hypothetical protein